MATSDPLHPLIQPASDYMESIRFFGRKAHDEVLELVALGRHNALAQCASSQRDVSAGYDLIRVDRDAERVIQRAKGKLYATGLRMAEQRTKPSKQKATKTSMADVIAALHAV